MHTDSRKSNMLRLLHHCLIAMCLAGSLRLLPRCCAEVFSTQNYEYESTSSPDYDYNATFDYSFFSNSSIEELENFLRGKDYKNENGEFDISRTGQESTVPSTRNKAFRTVYLSFLLTLILAAHQLLTLL